MEKTIKICGSEFPAKSTAASFISYKLNFHRDAMRDMLKLAKGMPKKAGSEQEVIDAIAESDSFDFDIFTRFLWVFAKAANSSLPPYEDWLGTFDVQPFDFIMEALPQVQDLLFSNMQTGVKAKNSPAAVRGRK